jgi:hypothetical protein
MVEDLTSREVTALSAWDRAASRLMVPMTFCSWIRRSPMRVESTTRAAWMMVSTWVARTMRVRSEKFSSVRTNSVRSRATVGSVVSRPMMTSTSGSASRARAIRPPQ